MTPADWTDLGITILAFGIAWWLAKLILGPRY